MATAPVIDLIRGGFGGTQVLPAGPIKPQSTFQPGIGTVTQAAPQAGFQIPPRSAPIGTIPFSRDRMMQAVLPPLAQYMNQGQVPGGPGGGGPGIGGGGSGIGTAPPGGSTGIDPGAGGVGGGGLGGGLGGGTLGSGTAFGGMGTAFDPTLQYGAPTVGSAPLPNGGQTGNLAGWLTNPVGSLLNLVPGYADAAAQIQANTPASLNPSSQQNVYNAITGTYTDAMTGQRTPDSFSYLNQGLPNSNGGADYRVGGTAFLGGGNNSDLGAIRPIPVQSDFGLAGSGGGGGFWQWLKNLLVKSD